jgi:phenylpyruvate tautomerase PptA (4-oxalocrotonate tautomerase family)
MKRDCVFFLADKTMRETFLGFLEREDRERELGCGNFSFDPAEDLFFAAGQNDPGLNKRAAALLDVFLHSHKKAVVVLDCEWEGSPGQAQIIHNITRQLHESGWKPEDVIVIAIDPELEQWIWQDSPVLAEELRIDDSQGLKSVLNQRGLWPQEAAKPPSPKALFDQLRRENNVKMSSAIFKRIATKVPVSQCQDSEFRRLTAKLREWFPAEGAA